MAEYREEDELDFDEATDDELLDDSPVHGQYFAAGTDQARWRGLTLDEKFKEVIDSLTGNWRWNESTGDPKCLPLETWKKDLVFNDWVHGEKSTPTFLHLLAKNTKDFGRIEEADRKVMVREALEHKARRQNQQDRGKEEPILNLAVDFDNDVFIDCVIECWNSGLADLIAETCREGRNCLHKIFCAWPPTKGKAGRSKAQQTARNTTLERAKKFLPKATGEAIAAKDNEEGNTPLHYAMRYRQAAFREGAEYVDLIAEMLAKGDSFMEGEGGPLNQANLSPILYYQSTMKTTRTTTPSTSTSATTMVSANEAPLDRPAPPKKAPVPEEPTYIHTGERARADIRPASYYAGMGRRAPSFPQTPFDPHLPGRTDFDLRRVPIDENEFRGSHPPSRPRERFFRDDDMPIRRVPVDENEFRRIHPPPRPRVRPPRDDKPPDEFTIIASRAPVVRVQGEEVQSSEGRDKDRNDSMPEKKDEPQERKEPENLSGPKLVDMFKKHYIRTRSDLEARNLIYGLNKSEINLSFDASGHDKSSDIVQLMERMSHGGFSDTLAYVSIPTVLQDEGGSDIKPAPKAYPMNHGTPMKKKPNPNIGRSSLVKVFDRLYRLNVRNILHLEVEDRRQPSHTDAAIERALQGRDFLITEESVRHGAISVETWDWRKPDLSVEVISYAAPDVTELNLYWSGNQAILRAWSCAEGLPKLKKLKTLRIFAAPGLETTDRMGKMLDRFEIDIKRLHLNVHIQPEISGLLQGLDSPRSGASWIAGHVQGEKQHDWIARMEEFRSALRGIHEDMAKARIAEPERVKVALLDDGVDLNRLDSYYSQTWDGKSKVDRDIVRALGVTYCLSGRQQSPWTISSRGHGTIMANMILRINPWVSLYSMKIQDGQDNDGRRTIFPGSAANAIRGAISRDVQIISMSWSIRNKQNTSTLPIPGHTLIPGGSVNGSESNLPTVSTLSASDENPFKMLEEAVEEAAKSQILMFCSATDDIQAGALDFLPYQKAQNYIFRIGAATAQGQRDPQAEDEKNIDYFFPGNQVAEALNPRSSDRGAVRYHDGSSVSTALAAGLSSLIMYLAIVVQTYYGDERGGRWFGERVGMLQRRNNMKQAFDNIDSQAWPDKKFLPVWEAFGQATLKIKAAGDLKGKMEVLDNLVRELCTKVR